MNPIVAPMVDVPVQLVSMEELQKRAQENAGMVNTNMMGGGVGGMAGGIQVRQTAQTPTQAPPPHTPPGYNNTYPHMQTANPKPSQQPVPPSLQRPAGRQMTLYEYTQQNNRNANTMNPPLQPPPGTPPVLSLSTLAGFFTPPPATPRHLDTQPEMPNWSRYPAPSPDHSPYNRQNHYSSPEMSGHQMGAQPTHPTVHSGLITEKHMRIVGGNKECIYPECSICFQAPTVGDEVTVLPCLIVLTSCSLFTRLFFLTYFSLYFYIYIYLSPTL